MRMIKMAPLALIAAFVLSACDPKVFENTLVGGTVGAVAGQTIWSKPVEGALVGGAIGAATALDE